MSSVNHRASVPPEMALIRLDLAVARLFPQYSRARLQSWIRSGELTLDGRCVVPREKVFGGEQIVIAAEPGFGNSLEPETGNGLASAVAEDIHLEVVFEDESLLVIDKPAALVVHPGAGNPDGTLLNGLLYHDPELAKLPRAGIVHRLDKDTSGLMVVARNIQSLNYLVKAIQERSVTRIYDAVVYGIMSRRRGTITASIARHPVNRKLMALRQDGKPAVTHYDVLTQFAQQAHVECRLETGRTHQIRVHFKSIGHPLVGDPLYGGQFRTPAGGHQQLADTLRQFPRQALHARKLALAHPLTGENLEFNSALPPDFAHLLSELAASV